MFVSSQTNERSDSFGSLGKEWGIGPVPQKLNFSVYQLNLPDNHLSLLFFSDTQLSLSSALNILGLSFTYNLNWKLHISSF